MNIKVKQKSYALMKKTKWYTISDKYYAVFGREIVLVSCMFACLMLGGCVGRRNQIDSKEREEAVLFNRAVDNFFAAVDSRDAEAIKKLFAPSALEEIDDIDDGIAQLFAFYSGPTDSCERDGGTAGKYNNQYGKKRSEISEWFAVVSGKITYYCDFTLVYKNDDNKDDVGIHMVSFVSEKVICNEEFEWPDELGINVIEDASGDYLTRRVGGYPTIYTPMERLLSEKDLLLFLEENNSLKKLKERFGEPNAETTPYTAYAYELKEENGEKRYADILVNNDTIVKVSVVDQKYFLRVLWEEQKDSGEK